ncbi:hypothetical protein [Aeromonas caviae]|uniref:hypothetical protein n=1 Tax=Aeromonas caviae TaxID=648 RepID=UPI003F7A3804
MLTFSVLVDDDVHLPGCLPEKGLIVFIGCGHAGTENIIERAREVCGDERIHAVIGGLHLKFSGPQRAAALARPAGGGGGETVCLPLHRQQESGGSCRASARAIPVFGVKKRQSEDCREECSEAT